MRAQLRRSVGAAGEGDDVGLLEAVEQVTGAADHQLQARPAAAGFDVEHQAAPQASVSQLVAVAGLAMQGMPARKLGANFSSKPQTGKLKA